MSDSFNKFMENDSDNNNSHYYNSSQMAPLKGKEKRPNQRKVDQMYLGTSKINHSFMLPDSQIREVSINYLELDSHFKMNIFQIKNLP